MNEAGAFGVPLDPTAVERLVRLVELLAKWNRVINLTRIETLQAIRVKHLVDSLAALPVAFPGETSPTGAALDLGAGAGFPGLVWMCARPELTVTLVDSDAKKVGFMKAALPALGLRGRALTVRLAGDPAREGLSPSACVVSRAFRPPAELLPLVRPYVAPGGALVGMWGPVARADIEAPAAAASFRITRWSEIELPLGLGRRVLARLE